MKLYTFKIWILLKHYSIQISSRVQLMTICRFCLRMLYKSLNSIRLTIFKRRRNSFSPLPFFSSIFCKLCKMHPKKSCSNVLLVGRVRVSTKTSTVIIFQKKIMLSQMWILSLATKFIAAFSGHWNFCFSLCFVLHFLVLLIFILSLLRFQGFASSVSRWKVQCFGMNL